MNQPTANVLGSTRSSQSIMLIPRREVERITGMSKSWLYQAMSVNQFPKPVVCSGSPRAPSAVRWVLAEVEAWINERIRERDKLPLTDGSRVR